MARYQELSAGTMSSAMSASGPIVACGSKQKDAKTSRVSTAASATSAEAVPVKGRVFRLTVSSR